MLNLSAIAVRERALTLFAIILVAISGFLAFQQIGRAEDPNYTVKVMVVTATWPGATPQEMATQVADKLEKRVQELRYFDKVETFNRPGLSILQITLKDSIPPEAVADQWYQVRKKLGDERVKLPAGVASLSFNDEFSDVYFALFALQAPGLSERELVLRAETLREQYLHVDGAQKVDIIGEQQQRFYVEFSYRRLATLGLATQQIFDALTRANMVTPGGSVETASDRIYLRLDNATATVDSIAATPIFANGRSLTLGDIATVRRGLEDPASDIVQYEGKRALMLGVVMRQGFNGSTFGVELHKLTEAIRDEMPVGMTLHQTADQAENISHATGEFALKFIVALVTVMIVSFVSLGLRTGIVVALAVPLTLGITFIIMLMTGRNFDRITLGALILSLGLLVDDAIIAIEMMVVKMESGMPRHEAAAFAWTSTAAPMLTGTLVTIAAFLPVGFAASSAGEYAGNIFWVTAFALITSWFVAVLFTPYLGVALLPDIKPIEGGHDRIYQTRLYRRLRGVITACVGARRRVLVMTLLAFVAAAVGMVLLVPKQFFPSSDRPELLVEVYMPQGTNIEVTRRMTAKVEELVAKAPETLYYSSFIGQGPPRFFLSANPELPDPAFAKMVVQTKGEAARDALKQRIDKALADGAVPGPRVRTTQLLFGPPVPFPINFRVLGPDIDQVRAIAAQVLDVAMHEPMAKAMHLEWGERAPATRLVIDQTRLRALGLTPQDVADQLQTLFDGRTITQVRQGIRTVDVVGRSIDSERGNLATLPDVTITNATGQSIALDQVARIETQPEDPLVKRYNRLVNINVLGDTAVGIQPPQASAAIEAKLDGIRAHLPPGCSIEVSGTPEESAKANKAIAALAPIMVLAMLTLIMLQVRSFPAMFMTILTAPLGLIGAVPLLLIFNAPFGFTAILGLLGLAGILMRNTLILLEQIHENEAEGRQPYDAVIEAAVHRARPVALTAVAGMLAFSPLTLTALWGPMAITLIGGFGGGTILTLLFLPALYAFWFKVQKVDTEENTAAKS